MRLAVDFAGLALFLYAIGWALTRCCTKNQMENYLVSEMFSYRLEKPENKEHDVTTVEEGPKCLRGATSGSFYNEICHSDDEILDTSSLN